MDGELITWIFLIGGLILMLLEMVLPGGVAFFLGLSGTLIGGMRFLGFLEDPITATGVWLGLSMVMTIAIRPFIGKYFKGETSYKHANEDFEAMDEVVEVLEEVNEFDNSGRIRYQGISWQAQSLEGTLPAGSRAVIKYRQNTTWIVEPSDDLGAGPELDQIEAPKDN
jgi:membrane protein implicated in regulation of membrane protease activity